MSIHHSSSKGALLRRLTIKDPVTAGNYLIVHAATGSETMGTSAAAGTLDLDWIIQGSNNTITSSINIDQATNYMDIDGSDNTITYVGTGVNASSGGYMWLDHTGGSRTINVTQASLLNNDWVKITSNGSNGTFCVDQDDGGTTVGC